MNLNMQVTNLSDLVPFIENKSIKLNSIEIELDLNYLSKLEFNNILDILNEIETGIIRVNKVDNKMNSRDDKLYEVVAISQNKLVSVTEFLKLYYKTDTNRNHTIAFNKWLIHEGYQELSNNGYKLVDDEMGSIVGVQIKWKYNLLKQAVSSVNLVLSQLMRTFGGENVE